MFSVNLQTTFMLPPFGPSLFYLKSVCPPEVKTTDLYKGIIPFVVIQLIMLGILALWPQLVTRPPKMVYG